jgi:hypothetical protein
MGAFLVGCQEEAKSEAKQEMGKPAAQAATAKAASNATMGPYEFSSNWMDEEGFITHWLIVGPFPNPGERPDNKGFNIDYLKNYGGEAMHTPKAGMEIAKEDGTTVKWQQYESTYTEISFFAVEHLGLDYDQEDVLVYCACWLKADADKDVEIRIGSDDGYKMWLNHKLIGTVHEYRGAEIDQEIYQVKLNKGTNLLMLKVDQDWGEYEMMVRVVDSEGKAVPGIEVWN